VRAAVPPERIRLVRGRADRGPGGRRHRRGHALPDHPGLDLVAVERAPHDQRDRVVGRIGTGHLRAGAGRRWVAAGPGVVGFGVPDHRPVRRAGAGPRHPGAAPARR
jgi:hypothetical protein